MAAMMNNTSQPKIPIFNGKNYDVWSVKVRTLFCSQDLWDLVEKGFVEPKDHTAYQALSQNRKKRRAQRRYFSFNNQWMSHYFQEFLEQPNENKLGMAYKLLIMLQQR